MLTIIINGKETRCARHLPINDLLYDLDIDKKTVAVAINREFVARSQWATRIIQENDRIEILSPVQGG